MNSLQDAERTIEELAIQVSRDLEERVWLRKLAEHLDCCQADTMVEDVAAQILPSLCGVIGAQAIVLLVQDEFASPDAPLTAHWYGEFCTTEATCRVLVDLLKSRAQQRVAVKNRLRKELSAPAAGELSSCMLATIQRHASLYGWLLALEKIPDEHTGWIDPGIELGKDEFGTVEADLLAAAATLLSTHARNVELFREKERLLIGAVRALVNALDARDQFSRGHSERVAAIARRIGQEFRLSPRDCERLYLSGLLHDIGKIGIPDSLLKKLDRLTDDEFDQIKEHSEIGAGILKELAPMSDVLPGILHHHERIDGRGYPHGLKGDSIPLFARILAVADSYDAMVSDRPYRAGMSHEKAEAILQDGAGTQWDAQVIKAFFASRDELRKLVAATGNHPFRQPTGT